MNVLDDTAALTRYCQVCQARPKQPCRNTIQPGEPLPGRTVHHARSTNLPDADTDALVEALF